MYTHIDRKCRRSMKLVLKMDAGQVMLYAEYPRTLRSHIQQDVNKDEFKYELVIDSYEW